MSRGRGELPGYRHKGAGGDRPHLEFSPWFAFLLAVRFGGVYWGATVGIVVAVVVLARAIVRHKVHLFDVVGVVYFGGMLILLAALDPSDIATLGRYAQAVAHGSLILIVFGSILSDRPFTEPYAREQVPKRFWSSPDFRATNRKIFRCGGWPSSLARGR